MPFRPWEEECALVTERRFSFGDDAQPDDASGDAALLMLCESFIASARARSVEGARLDGMPWSAAVNGGYGELCRGEPAHRSMLVEILAAVPTTMAGLLAKAHAVRVYRRDSESEPVSYAALADDIIRLLEAPAERRDANEEAAADPPDCSHRREHAAAEG